MRSSSLFGAAILALLCSFATLARAAESTEVADRDGRVLAGDAALKKGDCRAAAEAYVQAAATDRNPRVARRALGVADFCKHLPAQWQAARRLYELDPENPDALRAVGVAALDAWQIDFARRAFTELLAKPDVDPARAWGEILPPLTEGAQTVAAWRVFETLVPRDQVDGDVLLQLATMACNADDLAPCADLLAAARIKGVGNDPRSTRMAAALAVGQGDAARALLEAQRAAKDDPVNQRYAVVETLFALDRIDEARIELGRIASDKSQAAEADRRLGLLDLSSGDLVAAERRFGARLERKEGAGEALDYLAVIAERLGRTDAALRGYQQLIAAGGALTVRTRAAQLLIASGERETATALFDDLLRGNADTVIDVELARANVFAEAGEFDLALAGLDAALQRRPSHPQLLYQRAVTLDAASRTREGVAVLEQMLRDRPDEGTVMNALGYTLADRKLQLSRAEKLIRAALAQRPDNAAFIDSLGWVRYRRNDLKSARTLLTRAYALSRQAEIAAHLGEVLWESGDRAGASAVWARALASSPESKPLRAVHDRYAPPPKSSGTH